MVVARKTAMAIDFVGFILFSTKDTQVEQTRVPGAEVSVLLRIRLTVDFLPTAGNEKGTS